MAKIVLGLLALLVTLVTVILLAAVYVLHAPQGLEWGFRLAASQIPGELSVDQLSGRLTGPFTLQGLHYRSDGTDLGINRLTVQWQPGDLIKGELNIQELEVSGVKAHSAPPSKGGGKAALPDIRLPVAMNIGHATLSDLSVKGTHINRVEINGARFKKSKLDIRKLAVNAPSFRFTASGQVSPQGSYPLDVSVEWSANGGEFAILRGETHLSGNMETLHVRQQLSAPLQAQLRGTVTHVLGDLGWQAELSFPTINLQRLRESWPDLAVGGTVQVSGTLKQVQAEGQIQTTYRGLHAENNFAARYGDDALQVSHLTTTLAGSGIQLKVHGSVQDLGVTPQADLRGSWSKLRWPLQGNAQVRSAAGQFSLTGTLSQYQIQAEGDLAGPQFPNTEWTLQAQGTPQQLDISRLELHTLEGIVTAEGSAGWQPQPRWDVRVKGSRLNPGARWPAWPGQLAFTIHSSGRIEGGKPQAQVTLSSLQGTLQSLPVHGSGRFALQGESYQLSRLRLSSGGSHLNVEGTIDRNWDLRWQINIPNLSRLVNNGAGKLRGGGAVRGPRRQPLITATLGGGQLSYDQYHLGQAGLEVVLDLHDEVPSVIALQAGDISAGKLHWKSVRLRGEGSLHDHRLEFTSAALGADVALQAVGHYQQGHWQGTLNNLEISTSLLDQWQLAAPAKLTVDAGAVQVGTLCLQHARSRACTQGEWSATQGWQIQTALHAIPLALFKPWLPSDINLSGNLRADVHAAANADGFITANGEVRIEAALLPPDLTAKEAGVSYHPTTITLTLDQQGLSIRLQSDLAGGGNFQGHLDIARAALPAPVGAGKTRLAGALSGALQGEAKNLGLLPAFVPALEHTQGRLAVNLSMGGSWDDPLISGDIRLENGSAVIPALGITPDAINLAAHDDQQGHLHLEGSLRSKGSILHLTGDISFDPSRGLIVQARASGNKVEVMNTPEYHILASPNLQLNVKGHRIEVDGEVVIPEANLRPRDLSGAVSVSDDVVIVGAEEPPASGSHWQIYSQIRLQLGNFVKFNGFGLKGLLSGDVTLNDAPQRPTTGRGELSINNGEYKAYGQKLTIDRGRLLFFGGPVENPGLDIRAVRHIQEVTAGIAVRGSLKAPQVQIFSEPAMSQGDALSYLLIGQPINQATTTQGQDLYGAALSLGLAGSGLLANQIGQRFGIDELSVESGGGFGGGALVIRHYLSPRLYISYGVGLVERLNVFSLRYQISQLWSLDAQSGAQSGADLVYTMERK